MKAPFVSRQSLTLAQAAADYALAMWKGEVAARIEDRTEADARYRDLLEKYHALALPPVPSSPVIATTVREPRKPDVVAQAIRDEAAGDTRLAAFFRKRANELKAEHKDWEPQQIADALRDWQSTEHDGQA